ncbi:ABC transporter permease family protein [Gimesia aquarii]|uniref:ABC-2 family transporter protein n=1 Tax=Gimesia aquarii TaxID=2527964 RepID=A0A517VWT1_9PLAN|nr:hypothetical protein [Gimesia aquarii]QDT97442.1 ABC-2 family transporter protein [Gimesia aquarii]
MFQGTFALFNRALNVDFRLMRTHLFRFLFAVMILFFLMSAHVTSRAIGASGLVLFSQIIYLNFVVILMAGISIFATAITEEKEEQTMGLLLMAGVNPISLMLGKSMPRLVTALLLLSVQFPFTLLSITLGGVTLAQVIAAYSALAAFLFCLANLGLLCSVVCARSRSASTLVVIALAFFFLGFPFLEWVFNVIQSENWITKGALLANSIETVFDWRNQISVLSQINSILATGFSDSPWGIPFWGHIVFGFILFVFSCMLFNRFALIDVGLSPGRGVISKKKSHTFSPSRTWDNALMWKDFYFLNGGVGMTLIKFVCYGIALLALCIFIGFSSNQWDLDLIGYTVFWSMFLVILIEISLISARIFQVEIQWNTLVSTAMLPQSMARIAYSKLSGCLLSLIPACCYLMFGSLFIIDEIFSALDEILPEPTFWMMCVEVFFFWHLTAFLSTYIKWGALPLAFVLMWVGNTTFFIMVSIISIGGGVGQDVFEALSLFFSLGLLACIVGSHFLIKERLVLLASK